MLTCNEEKWSAEARIHLKTLLKWKNSYAPSSSSNKILKLSSLLEKIISKVGMEELIFKKKNVLMQRLNAEREIVKLKSGSVQKHLEIPVTAPCRIPETHL